MKIKKIAAFGAAFGIVIAGLSVASAANADPVTDGYAFVGSDTLQDAVGALANGTNVTGPSVRTLGAGKFVASWNAFTPGISGGRGLIQTKSGTAAFPRPTGSGDGKKSLLASIGGVTGTNHTWAAPTYTFNGASDGLNGNYTINTNTVDGARSSDGPTAGNESDGVLYYVPFGQDAVTYALKVGSNVDASAVSAAQSLTASQLEAIYKASSPTPIGSSDDVIVPVEPQAGSGTRKFWNKALNSADHSTEISIGAAVVSGGPENDGTNSTLAAAAGADKIAIIPFSVASYIAQNNLDNTQSGFAAKGIVNTTTGLSLGSLGGVAGYTGSGHALTPNTSYYSGSNPFSRTTYVIVSYDRVNPSSSNYDKGLANAVDPTIPTSLAYWSAGDNGTAATSEKVKKTFGFAKPVSAAKRSN
ncbi:hypothetical protein DEU37_0747 [Microbacterium sp. AG790]|uniref:hypothetical protein n=1 Tax=Microbacterium sp. AG790 TaxID=2183995 RepID=UPI000EAF5D1A|nr:hypothetical protein [Microbacterium sp. AG790]RKS93342.1 hypothetical protein DEU37_0747 [Microbacterium sp. AG790]